MDAGERLAALLGAVLLLSLAGAQQSVCPPLPDIPNGFITYATDDIDLSMVATYSCDAGYFLDLSLGGSEMRTCVDGFWNNLEPSCINAPSVLCFAAVDSSCGGMFLGSTDSLSCCLPPQSQGLGGGGYVVNGIGDCIGCTVGLLVTFDPPSYMVMEGGVVNLRVVVSGEVDTIVSIQFTTVEDSANNDDFVPTQTILNLNPGIHLLMVAVETIADKRAEGDEVLIGRLTSDHPLVTLGVSQASVIILDDDAVCDEVPLPDNGLVSYDSNDFPLPLDTIANYSCNPGYSLNGPENSTCVFVNGSTTFAPEPPLCDPACDELLVVANGLITYSEVSITSYSIGTVATYSCNQGYELRLGDETRTCVDLGLGGIFIGVAPTCENTPPPVCPTSTYLDGSNCSVQCPPSNIGNHRTGLCQALPTEFEILTNATAYFVTMVTTTQPDTVALNYSVFLNQSGISAPIISLSLQSPLYSQEILTFDNGNRTKSYIPPSLPEGYSVDESDIATFKETILYRGEVPQGLYRGGQASLQLDLTSVVSPSEILGEMITTPMFVTIMQQEQVVCQELELLVNGSIQYSPDVMAPYLEGTNAEHICVPGFILIGNVIRVCQSDSTFSGVPPMCQPIQCLPLEEIENGLITYVFDDTPNFDLNAVAIYACNDGFVLVISLGETESRTCVDDLDNDAEGVFNGQAPACIPIECPPLTAISNGVITYATDTIPNFDMGTVATYSCDAGYFLDLSLGGSEMRTCVDDNGLDAIGEFDRQEPRCILIQCSPLPAITNGFITYTPDNTPDFDLDTVATYSCGAGFVLDLSLGGTVTRTCLDDMNNDAEGLFSGQAPACISIECPPLTAISNGVITYATDTTANYDLGTVATYSCDAGYFLDLSLGGSEMRTCVDDDGLDAIGVFDRQEPRCILIQCSPLPAITNGFITYAPDNTPDFDLDTVATYSCGAGFVLDLSLGGTVTRTCVDDLDNDAEGLFSGQAPACISIECPPLTAISNGVITYATDTTANYDLGTVATYSCDAGYFLDLSLGGSEMRTCVDDDGLDAIGVFDRQEPRCILIQCSPLPAITNGFITYAPDNTPDFDLDTVATYSCGAGFVLDLSLGGTVTRTCVDDLDNDAEGLFSGQAPACIPIECLVLPAFANGMIVYATDVDPNFDLGTTATYSCDDGYTLDLSIGVAKSTNERARLIAERIQCVPLPDIPNGMIEYGPDTTANYMLGTTATYICNDGFFLDVSVGNEVRTCVDDDGLDDLGVFTGSQPTCVRFSCDDLPVVDNAVITYSSTTLPRPIATVATYSCNTGYALEGIEIKTCVEFDDGTVEFDPQETPSCVPECDAIPAPPNAVVTYNTDPIPPFPVGALALFECIDGFSPVTTSPGEPTTFPLPNELILVECRETVMGGGGVFVRNGTSSQVQLNCTRDCVELPAIPNGMISYAPDMTANYSAGTVATYTCDDGFELAPGVGNSMRTCLLVEQMSDATPRSEFDGAEPRCEQRFSCDDLPAVDNAVITYSSTTLPRPIATVATYSCNTGYALEGIEIKTCVELDDGTVEFDPQETPSCVPECDAIPAPPNTIVTYSVDPIPPFPVGALAIFECIDGFGPVTTTPGEPQTFPLPNELILLECGETVMGGGGVFVRNGTSSQVQLSCTRDCVELPAIPNGMILYAPDMTANYSAGTVATYTCDDGFVPRAGNSMRTCVPVEQMSDAASRSEFDGAEPRCEQRFSCDDLPAVDNAVITYSSTTLPRPIATVATYSCNTGYALEGIEIKTCVEFDDGTVEFDPQETPSCVPECDAIPAPPNTIVTYNTDPIPPFPVGALAIFECIDGFSPVTTSPGEPTTFPLPNELILLECGEIVMGGGGVFVRNGTSSQVQLSCTRDCVQLPAIPNGVISYAPDMMDNYSAGTVATYTCDDGFELVPGVGNSMRTCLPVEQMPDAASRSEFDGAEPSCESLCPALSEIDNGMIVYRADTTAPYDIGTVATYSCNPGYAFTGGNNVRTCEDPGDGNNNRFNGEAPTCELLPPDAVTVGMESARVTVSEGQDVVGVVIIKDLTQRDLLVTVRLDSITATGGVDYGPFSNPIVRLPVLLPANDTRVTFYVPLRDDNIVEDTETFRVTLESLDSSVFVVGIHSTVVSIEDDDVVEFILSLRDGSPTVVEGNLQLTFNLTKEGEAARNVRIVVQTQDDSATGAGDYTILELPLTFAPSETLMEFTVDVRDDSIVETMEMFFVTFEPAVGETGVAPITMETVITIVDDNDLVSVGLASVSPLLEEGATGLVQLESSGNNEIPVTVAIDVSNFGTATVGLDFYLNISNITFEPGVMSLFIPVVAISDGLYEGEDESVILIGRPGDGETRVQLIPGSEQATFHLVDTDSVSVGFLVSEVTVSESSGPVNVTIVIVNGRLATDIVLRVDATGDLAELNDFDFQSVELTFGPGRPNVSMVTIGIRDDSVFEGREGFSLSLTSSSPRVDFDPQILQVLIVDNEDLIVLFSSTVYTVQETDSSVDVRVQLGPDIRLQRDITLDLRTLDGAPPTGATGGLDFQPVNTTLTFGPGVTMATRTVFLLDDQISEGLENFEVQVVLVDQELGDPGVVVSATVLVFDNENIFVSLSSAEYIVEEGRGLVVIVIEKSGITPGNQDTLVLLTLSDGTARGGMVDYGPFPVTTPTSTLRALLLANDTQTLFGIPIAIDNLVEGDESFFVALSIANEQSIEEGGIVFLGNLTMATVVITDDDVINVLLVIDGQEVGVVSVEEGGVALPFSAVRDDNVRLARNVTMVARTTTGTARGFTDFSPANITLEFLAGVQKMDFSVFLLDDTVAEGNESFTVILESSDPGVVISSGTVEIIIIDNDVALINFAQESYDAFELDRSVEVCLTKSADTAVPVTISLVPMETADPPDDAVPAIATIDFDSTPLNVTFDPTATQACVRVVVIQDNLAGEGLEVFTLTLGGLEGIVGRGSRSTVNVLLNDVPDVIFGLATVSPVIVAEGVGRVEVCVTVFNPAPSEPLNTTLTVTIETISGTADDTDYTPVTAVLVLDNSLRSDCFQVRILDDELFEDPVHEDFSINISNVESTNSDFRIVMSPTNVTVVIADDDRSVTIGFSDVFYSVNESDNVRVCVVVTIPPPMERFTQQDIVLRVSTVPGTANESDYLSFSDRIVGTVSNNNRETCFIVEVINDEIVEQPEETFSLVLSVEVPMDSDLSVSLDPSVAIVIITDNDEPPPPPTPTVIPGTTPTPTLSIPGTTPTPTFTLGTTLTLGTTPTPTVTLGTTLTLGTTPTPTVTLGTTVTLGIPGTTSTPTVTLGTTPTPTPLPTGTPTPVVRGNDTIVGDPLFSVPLNLVDGSELLELKTLLHLCYEIHGSPDTYFNLVSDECTNINAYYTGVVLDTKESLGLNIITQIGVRAIDSLGNCVRVRIDSASNCTPVVMTAEGGVVSEVRYDRDGVIVSKVRNRVRVSVPNCGGNRLVMWVTCQDPGGMMRFDITRGVGLTPTSHGLLGQFWNVPVTIRKYTYIGDEELYLDIDQLYVATVTNPNTGSTRRFIAEFGGQVWDLSNKDCLYAGNIQGGRLGDIDDASVSDSVVEGRYSQYIVDGLFDHNFDYFRFNADICV